MALWHWGEDEFSALVLHVNRPHEDVEHNLVSLILLFGLPRALRECRLFGLDFTEN